MGKIQLLVIDRNVIESGHHSAFFDCLDLKDNYWIKSVIDEQLNTPLDVAIAKMQESMIKLGLKDNGFICNDRQGLKCWHIHSTTPLSSLSRLRDVAHPLHENANCQKIVGSFTEQKQGILQHLVQHYSLQKLPLECLLMNPRGVYLITHSGYQVTVDKVAMSKDNKLVSEIKLLSLQSSDFRNDPFVWGRIAAMIG